MTYYVSTKVSKKSAISTKLTLEDAIRLWADLNKYMIFNENGYLVNIPDLLKKGGV